MLNLTVRPGEYLQIGEDIKLVFVGGTNNNLKVMVDAPRKYNIVRSTVLEKHAKTEDEKKAIPKYYKEEIPEELVKKIKQNARAKQRESAYLEAGR